MQPRTWLDEQLPQIEAITKGQTVLRLVGQPVRSHYLPFCVPEIGEEEIAEVVDTLKSGWLTTGPKTREFETQFANYVSVNHAIAVNSCTAALHLALDAIGLQAGDEVITTPYTFAATAEVIQYFNAVPVLVDICADDFNIDPDQLEAAITDRTRAIIPVHIAGVPADLQRIYAIAEQHELAVIEDAAHAFPVLYGDRYIGAPPLNPETGKEYNVKSAVCFSFYATKTITTGEGGMLCTNNDEIAQRSRIMALHGISADAWKRYSAEGSWYYEIVDSGYKYNMTDVAASLGLVQLRKAQYMADRRRQIADWYNEAFNQIPQLQGPVDYHEGLHTWHLYMLRLNLDQLTISRAQFVRELKERNIGVSVHFIPLHLHPHYREQFGYEPEDLPVANEQYQREISLPLFSQMSNQDAEDVICAVIDVVQKFAK